MKEGTHPAVISSIHELGVVTLLRQHPTGRTIITSLVNSDYERCPSTVVALVYEGRVEGEEFSQQLHGTTFGVKFLIWMPLQYAHEGGYTIGVLRVQIAAGSDEELEDGLPMSVSRYSMAHQHHGSLPLVVYLVSKWRSAVEVVQHIFDRPFQTGLAG
jgi:hypothetical protein